MVACARTLLVIPEMALQSQIPGCNGASATAWGCMAPAVESARTNEVNAVAPLLDRLHMSGIDPETCAMDKGYDNTRVYGDCDERGVVPIVPLRNTRDVKVGNHLPPFCKHGSWRFAGADHRRTAWRGRGRRGGCTPAWVWIRPARPPPPPPREARRGRGLYGG